MVYKLHKVNPYSPTLNPFSTRTQDCARGTKNLPCMAVIYVWTTLINLTCIEWGSRKLTDSAWIAWWRYTCSHLEWSINTPLYVRVEIENLLDGLKHSNLVLCRMGRMLWPRVSGEPFLLMGNGDLHTGIPQSHNAGSTSLNNSTKYKHNNRTSVIFWYTSTHER